MNFTTGETQRELYGYAIAAKRYALFTQTPEGGIHVEKASAHGLGFLYPPSPGFDDSADAPVWVVEAWDWILRGALGLQRTDGSWFGLPAMMRLTITTPEVLKVLQARQQALPYSHRMKPFNFILSPMIDRLTGGHPIGTARPVHADCPVYARPIPLVWALVGQRARWEVVPTGASQQAASL